jgi:hypothetical protein
MAKVSTAWGFASLKTCSIAFAGGSSIRTRDGRNKIDHSCRYNGGS